MKHLESLTEILVNRALTDQHETVTLSNEEKKFWNNMFDCENDESNV